MKPRFEAVVAQRGHADAPFLAPFEPVEKLGGDDIVTVRNDVGSDPHVFVGDALDGVASTVDDGLSVEDEGSRPLAGEGICHEVIIRGEPLKGRE